MQNSESLTDANLSIGPMSWCNYCQQNVGGVIKHKAGCKTLTDAELLALKLANPERYGIDGPVVVTEPINILDAPVSTERLEQLEKMIECSAPLGIEAANPGAQQQLEVASALRELNKFRDGMWRITEMGDKYSGYSAKDMVEVARQCLSSSGDDHG